MNIRHHFLSIATILTVLTSAALAEPLLPENIVYQDTRTQQVTPYKDGVLVESDGHAADFVMYAQYGEKETKPVEIDGLQLIFDAEKTSKGILYLGMADKKIAIIEETTDGKRSALPVPEAFHPRYSEDLAPSTRPLLIACNHRAAAVAGKTVWWLDKEWNSKELPGVPKFHHAFRSTDFGEKHYYLEGTTLYVGWNHGEWGGALASIDISKEDPKWIKLSEKATANNAGVPQRMPIHSIISPSPGHLWVAAGLAHLSGHWRGLYHRDTKGKWHTLVDGEFDDDRGPKKDLNKSCIQGIAGGPDGKIYILGGNTGIYKLDNGEIEQVIKHDFFEHSSQCEGEEFVIGCYPESIGISKGGDIYVTTNCFGILAFRKKGDTWTVQQITLHKPAEKNLLPDSLPPFKPKEE